MTRKEQIKEAAYEAKAKHIGYGDSVVYAFIDGALWADAHPHWISVEDELPKEDGTYLFYDAESQGAFFSYFWADLTLNENISHWMRIKKPTGKENNNEDDTI